MGERVFAAGSEGAAAYACPAMAPLAECALSGIGALCASEACVFAADCRDQAIWRLDAKTLIPTGMFSGGPGIAQMMLSKDGQRLYALCSEADSLLMLSAQTGAPMVVNRVGVCPYAMVMDARGETIAVAGGACGEVLLLSAHSLSLMERFSTRGIVFSAAIAHEAVYALSLSETMNTVLTAFLPGGVRREWALGGMPGALAMAGGAVFASTHQAIYAIDREGGVSERIRPAGRAGRLWVRPWGMLMTDTWTESLFVQRKGAMNWQRIGQGIKDAVIL